MPALIKRIFTRNPTAALGEMILIIFGILIALQIDNWNENRKESELRYSALEEVQGALQADLVHIKNRIDRAGAIADSLTWLSGELEDKRPYDKDVADAFAHLQYSIVFEPRTGPFETLKANGLNVLDQIDLESSLIRLYDYAYPRMQWMLEQELNHFNQTVSTPLMYEYFQLKRKAPDAELHDAEPLSYEAILESTRLLTTIRRKADKARSIQQRFERVQNQAVALLAKVDAALEQDA